MLRSRISCAVASALLALFADGAVAATRGIWLSPSEIQSLPMSGPAWDNVRTAAYGNWGTPAMANQDVKHGVSVLAGALVYVRTGDAALRAKVRDGILAAKRTHDDVSEFGRTLSLGRQLGAYVIAADLIDLESFDPSADAEFRPWVDTMRTATLPLSNARWSTLVRTHENSANNWGTFAGASRIAASLYLGDTADVARAAKIFEAWLGNRSAYPANAPGLNGYFEPTADFNATWICNPSAWTAVNPACVLSGIDVNGVVVEDIARGGSLGMPPGATGMMYSWEVLQGVYVQAEMLRRVGYDPYNWSNQALRRAMDFMVRAGWQITNVAQYVPWIANKRYGTTFSTNAAVSPGRIMGWTSWTHASANIPSDVTRPAPITDLSP